MAASMKLIGFCDTESCSLFEVTDILKVPTASIVTTMNGFNDTTWWYIPEIL
jgi:hypothetical protein